MSRAQIDLDLRSATPVDAEAVADLETARLPDDPADPAMVRFWWTAIPAGEVFTRLMAERDGSAIAYMMVRHRRWADGSERFGTARILLHPELWSGERYEHLVDMAESWPRDQAAAIAVIRVRADFTDEVRVLQAREYNEVRRGRPWELDLVANRASLLAGAELSRKRMSEQGVRLLTLDRDDDPDRLAKLHVMSLEAEQDVPTTVPAPRMPYDEWHHLWFDNPGIRTDRMWIAREGDDIVGLSALEYPPTRGCPWTAFTTTGRTVRGRGIARALKYETVAQAIALGVDRIRTENDGENAPILHINGEMGYVPIEPVLELHRPLAP
jgi:acetyltransferase (GNAT) family protein